MSPALLMVLITGAVVLAGCAGPPPLGEPGNRPPLFAMHPGNWSLGEMALSVDVYRAGNSTPAALRFTVVASNGDMMYSGPAGAGNPVNGTSVSIEYDDFDANSWVSDGDAIRLSVRPPNPLSIQGGRLEVRCNCSGYSNDIIGELDPIP